MATRDSFAQTSRGIQSRRTESGSRCSAAGGSSDGPPILRARNSARLRSDIASWYDVTTWRRQAEDRSRAAGEPRRFGRDQFTAGLRGAPEGANLGGHRRQWSRRRSGIETDCGIRVTPRPARTRCMRRASADTTARGAFRHTCGACGRHSVGSSGAAIGRSGRSEIARPRSRNGHARAGRSVQRGMTAEGLARLGVRLALLPCEPIALEPSICAVEGPPRASGDFIGTPARLPRSLAFARCAQPNVSSVLRAGHVTPA